MRNGPERGQGRVDACTGLYRIHAPGHDNISTELAEDPATSREHAQADINSTMVKWAALATPLVPWQPLSMRAAGRTVNLAVFTGCRPRVGHESNFPNPTLPLQSGEIPANLHSRHPMQPAAHENSTIAGSRGRNWRPGHAIVSKRKLCKPCA